MNQEQAEPRRQRRSGTELRLLIVDSARAEFKQFGYSGATTAAIARGAKVSETQLFRLFPSKAVLFREAVFEPLDQSFAVFNDLQFATKRSGTPKNLAETQAYITELMTFIEQNRAMLVPLLVAHLVDREQVEGVAKVSGLATYFDLGSEQMVRNTPGLTRDRSDKIVRVSFAAVLASVVFRDWLFPPEKTSEDDLAATLAGFFVNGFDVGS